MFATHIFFVRARHQQDNCIHQNIVDAVPLPIFRILKIWDAPQDMCWFFSTCYG
ncbi:MAG: hypothetical protein QNJ63_15230 [Calothrix sp. MO_192.B10]|nr:hypothetical protein [Calothrix sp. MO_192.B10]